MAPESNEAPAVEVNVEAETPRTFTQEDVDRIVADRLKREGVRDLKVKAAQFDQLEQSSKSEMQRLTEQIAQLTKAQAEADARATRYRIAAAAGISNEDADLFLTGPDEETIAAQAKRLAERDAARKAKGNVVPAEGRTPTNPADPSLAFARQLFGKQA